MAADVCDNGKSFNSGCCVWCSCFCTAVLLGSTLGAEAAVKIRESRGFVRMLSRRQEGPELKSFAPLVFVIRQP